MFNTSNLTNESIHMMNSQIEQKNQYSRWNLKGHALPKKYKDK